MVLDVQDPGSNYIRLFNIGDGTTNEAVSFIYIDSGIFIYIRSGAVTTLTQFLGAWPTGKTALAYSIGTDYTQVQLIGQAPVKSVLAAPYPVLTETSYLGSGYSNTSNTVGTVLEHYQKAGSQPNDTTFDEVATLMTARFNALV